MFCGGKNKTFVLSFVEKESLRFSRWHSVDQDIREERVKIKSLFFISSHGICKILSSVVDLLSLATFEDEQPWMAIWTTSIRDGISWSNACGRKHSTIQLFWVLTPCSMRSCWFSPNVHKTLEDEKNRSTISSNRVEMRCRLGPPKQKFSFHVSVQPFVSRIKQNRLKGEDFETLQIIGRGSFGQGKPIDWKRESTSHPLSPSSDVGEDDENRTNFCHENLEQIESFAKGGQRMFPRRVSGVDVWRSAMDHQTSLCLSRRWESGEMTTLLTLTLKLRISILWWIFIPVAIFSVYWRNTTISFPKRWRDSMRQRWSWRSIRCINLAMFIVMWSKAQVATFLNDEILSLLSDPITSFLMVKDIFDWQILVRRTRFFFSRVMLWIEISGSCLRLRADNKVRGTSQSFGQNASFSVRYAALLL